MTCSTGYRLSLGAGSDLSLSWSRTRAAGGLQGLHEDVVDIKKMGHVVVDIAVVRHLLIEKGAGLRPHRLKGVFGGMTTKVDSTCRFVWHVLLKLM